MIDFNIIDNSKTDWDRSIRIQAVNTKDNKLFHSFKIDKPEVASQAAQDFREMASLASQTESGQIKEWHTYDPDPFNPVNRYRPIGWQTDFTNMFCGWNGKAYYSHKIWFQSENDLIEIKNPVDAFNSLADQLDNLLSSLGGVKTITQTDEIVETIEDGNAKIEIIKRYIGKSPWKFRKIIRLSGTPITPDTDFNSGKIQLKSEQEVEQWIIEAKQSLPALEAKAQCFEKIIKLPRGYRGGFGVTRKDKTLVPFIADSFNPYRGGRAYLDNPRPVFESIFAALRK